MKRKSFETKTLKSVDGRTITYFDGKLHSWEGPALKYPSESNLKDEYWLYGFQYTKDEWKEQRRDRNGVSPEKNPQVKVRN